MRSISSWILGAALVLGAAACSDGNEPKGSERRVVLLFTTDEHAQLFASSPELDDFPLPTAAGSGTLVGGVARRLTVLEGERAAAQARGAATLTLSSGDFSQGSLASAAWLATSPELRLMKQMGYDAVALGNHEFDLGPAALAQAIGTAATAGEVPPLVLTNLFFSATSSGDDALEGMYGTAAGKLVAPYRVLTTSNGLEIGVVASMGVEAGTVAGAAPPVTFWDPHATTDDEKFASIVAAVQAAVDALHALDVDAIVLLGHGGIGATAADPGEDEGLGFLLSGVNVVLSGHSHLSTPQPRIMLSKTGPVPVVQAKAYGKEVGRLELVFRDDDGASKPRYVGYENVAYDAVDDRVLPTTNAAFLNELYTITMGYLESGSPLATTAPSFLESTLSKILATPVTDDPAVLGDLYFRPIGKTDFDVVGLAPGETAALDLDADAILAAANAIHPQAPTAVAVQASGPIRGDLRVGDTGAITFADLYHLVPLGGDPTATLTSLTDPNAVQTYLDAVPGYPLIRANIPTAALRGVLEQTLQFAQTNGDFFPGVSGLTVHYDVSRPAYDPAVAGGVGPGWITFMALANGAVLYDPTDPALAPTAGFNGNPLTMVTPAATTLYIATIASTFGVPLLDDTGAPFTSPAQAILRRPDASAVKDYEALGAFVKAQCDGNTAHPGFLPSRYDASTTTFPNRMIDCTGGCPR